MPEADEWEANRSSDSEVNLYCELLLKSRVGDNGAFVDNCMAICFACSLVRLILVGVDVFGEYFMNANVERLLETLELLPSVSDDTETVDSARGPDPNKLRLIGKVELAVYRRSPLDHKRLYSLSDTQERRQAMLLFEWSLATR